MKKEEEGVLDIHKSYYTHLDEHGAWSIVENMLLTTCLLVRITFFSREIPCNRVAL
jgi:hypothetical protein